MSILFRGEVFNRFVSGTGTVWYSPAEYNEALARGDGIGFLAVTTDVGGTSPTISVVAEHSADGRHWNEATGVLNQFISGAATEGGVYGGVVVYWPTILSFVRFKISLGGTSPRCHLQVFATSRNIG